MSQQMLSGKPLSNTELTAFCGQLHLILNAGIPVIEGLTIMLEDAQSAEEKALLEKLVSEMQATGSLYLAMESTTVFPAYLIHMIEIGEETGNLEEVTEALQIHYDREEAVRKSIYHAISYPAVMMGMMIVVILVLLVKVMPVFNQVFVQLGSEMTGFSRTLMQAGKLISRYSAALVVLMVLCVVAGIVGVRSAWGKNLLRKLGYHLSFTRAVYEKTAACRFAGAMALTLKSGLNLERSMELVASVNEDPYFQKKLNCCLDEVAEGNELSKAFLSAGIFSGMYAQMSSIGSRTGSMDQVMEQIAALYQEEIDTKLGNILSVLEPTLVVLLSVIVGVILLSVMLPLMGIMSSL